MFTPLPAYPCTSSSTPYKGEWYLHTLPKDDAYHSLLTLGFGVPVDLTSTVVGLTLQTDDFPRD
ncbi:hypothetical protein AB0M87_26320 [Streptomyces sp. NPDC051320]|uniref:hypothetical protein n=1 Tax=Streptomyces sp. NPDC051320 TaxID=3154644 RepID=UPI0034280015